MNGYNCYSVSVFIAFFYVKKIMLLMGCFLLQKNILLMRLILLDYYATFFPVKFPQISPSKHHTNPGVTFAAVCAITGHHVAGHRPFFTLRRYAHPASHPTKWRRKRIAQTLALNAQNRTLLQNIHHFGCKKEGCCSITNAVLPTTPHRQASKHLRR